MRTASLALLVWIFVFIGIQSGNTADWPMWRYDEDRTAASPQQLADTLYMRWMHEYPALKPVWDDPLNQDLMQYDTVYEPIVVGKTLLFGSNAFDRIVALDTETGREKWTFHAGGPIRLPAVANQKNVYFTSDDGCLYCVRLETGELAWKYNSVPKERLMLGNERLVSTWVARGGAVLKDDVVYFGSGIWPFMGVFLFALDAETGEEIWVNDSSSVPYKEQPHGGAWAFGGIAPQGTIAISGERLLVPCGRSVPASFDRKTGELDYYKLHENGKTGGAFVCATDKHFFNYYRDGVVNLYDTATGEGIFFRAFGQPVVTDQAFYCQGETITAYDYANLRLEEYEDKKKDKETGEVKIVTRQKWNLDTLWELDVDASGDLIKAGNRLYAGGKDKVTALELQQNKNAAPKVAWEADIEGTVGRLIAADDKLFVITDDGKIYSFGSEPEETKTYAFQPEKKQLDPSIEQKARAILKTTGMQSGYCFVFGLTNGDLAEALVRNSDLRVIAFDPDPQKVDTLRRRFTKAGLYGPRLSVIEDDVDTLKVVPYLASLTVFENASKYKKDQSFLKTLYHHTRPYGGTILLDIPQEDNFQTIKTVQTADLPKAKVYEREEGLLIAREGKLPGADDWTHQYGDIANTVKSDDERVKLPLGLLWYGGNSNMDVLPRHGHGPPEQVIGGRLFIEGMDCISARDVYTGRVLWKRTIPHLNNYMVYYDDTYKDTPLSTSYNQIHLPGANARGTNYIATKDTVYIIQEARCLLLDAKTGEDKGIIELPEIPTFGQPESWGYIGVYKDYLIAGMDFADYKKFFEIPDGLRSKSIPFLNYNITSSKHLVVMDRHNGEVKWAFKSDLGLLHNAIVVGNDKLFCMDKMPNPVADALQRRGKSYFGTPRIMAFDINTGDIAWSKTQGVFGTWLGYAEKHDILLQTGRPSRDMIHGEVTEGMKAYRGTTGEPLWENKAQYGGPCILHNETIITDPHAYSLLTGKTLMREDPITQTEIPWSYKRMYGCNYSIASEHLMTFRSGAAGFYDLNTNGGTGNFGGFKSSCTSNLVAADGVLNAPDYTRTCSCSYQNQTSLAMFHDPSVEIWTFNDYVRKPGEPIRQLGLNFGAPGDRRAENGALWLEYPNNGSPSPEVSVITTPDQPTWFLHHSSRYNEGNMNWVAASGVEGARTITITVSDQARDPELYSVRLFFAEPKQKKAGDRVFHVDLQGRRVLHNFDIVKEAGSIRTAVVREYNNIAISDKLTISLQPKNPDNEPILCGIELIATPAVQTTMKD